MSTSSNPIGQESNPPAWRDTLLEIHEQILTAQLLTVRKLRSQSNSSGSISSVLADGKLKNKRRSHLDMVVDILTSAATPLHVSEIIARISSTFGVAVDTESLVSALSKRVARKDRFARTARNTFALL